MAGSSPKTVLARNPRTSWRVLDGEAVILLPDRGTLHRLNGTGTAIWERLDGQRTLATIGAELSREFEVEPDAATDQIHALVAELAEAGLLEGD